MAQPDVNVVEGVFGLTPEMYIQQRQARDVAAQQQAAEEYGKGGFAPQYARNVQTGQLLQQGLQGLLGVEDPQLAMIREVQTLKNQFDITTPQGMEAFAKAIAPKYPQLALQAKDKAVNMLETESKAQTTKQKIDQEKKLREELAALPKNASIEDKLNVWSKYGDPNQQVAALEKLLIARENRNAKESLAADARAAQDASKLDRATTTLAATQDAAKLVGYTTAGAGAVLGMIPGTSAKNLQAKLETIKANLAADMLADMKSQSKTGASGLGALNKAELVMLQSARTSLDPNQSPDELKKSLEIVNKYYSSRANLPYKSLYGTSEPVVDKTTATSEWKLVPTQPSSGIPK